MFGLQTSPESRHRIFALRYLSGNSFQRIHAVLFKSSRFQGFHRHNDVAATDVTSRTVSAKEFRSFSSISSHSRAAEADSKNGGAAGFHGSAEFLGRAGRIVLAVAEHNERRAGGGGAERGTQGLIEIGDRRGRGQLKGRGKLPGGVFATLAMPPEALRVVATQSDEFDVLRFGEFLEQRVGAFEQQVFRAMET